MFISIFSQSQPQFSDSHCLPEAAYCRVYTPRIWSGDVLSVVQTLSVLLLTNGLITKRFAPLRERKQHLHLQSFNWLKV